jgi:hypothetical protein
LPEGEKKLISSIKLRSKDFSIAEISALFPEIEISPSPALLKPIARRSPPRSESKSGVTALRIFQEPYFLMRATAASSAALRLFAS